MNKEYLINYSLKAVLFPFCFLLAFNLPVVFAQEFMNDSAAEQLAEILSQNTTLQADVEQLTLSQNGQELQEVKARLVMEKPNHFYWAQSEPYEDLMLTNGEKVWRYEPDLEQVTIQEFDNDPNRTPVLLLNGDYKALEQSYDISRGELPDLRIRYVLLPQDPGSTLERLSFTFTGSVLDEMQFEDTLGQKTSLYFSNLETNLDIDPAIFEFQIPEGIEIIDTTED
jgi:outer membrane lipoprotein carrier protein